MDAKSAADGAEFIEQQINRVQKWRDNFAEYCASYSKDSKSVTTVPEKKYWEMINWLDKGIVEHLVPRSKLIVNRTVPDHILHTDGRVYENGLNLLTLTELPIKAGVNLSDFSLVSVSGAKQIKDNAMISSLYYRNNILNRNTVS
jgi:hypothetical protein